jgi:hypothetical protein
MSRQPTNRRSVPQADDAATRVDKDLVARAFKKVANQQELSAQERSALRRFEKQREEKLRWTFYGSIPQKHWRQMSGRQTKVLNEQAERYGIPFGGPTINLPSVVRAVHDFLAANSHRLAGDDDPMLVGGSSPALERYREERAALARMDRMERERLLVSRDEVREGLGRIAAMLRGAGDVLQRQFGPAALEVLNDALDDAQREIDRCFGDTDEPIPQHDTDGQ